MTPLQRRTLAYLATVDSATPVAITHALDFPTVRSVREHMTRLIIAGRARDLSENTRRCLYRITLQGRQAIAPPLVCVAWRNGQSAPLKPATAEALRVRLDGEMGPGTHRIVAT
tara:strand:- start:210 stop:551 length:342 start_codon:yes stop_codon:yes gene_type:complete